MAVSPMGVPDPIQVLQELKKFQAALLEKASTYTKIILGLGYGGFFTAWAGTRQRSPATSYSAAKHIEMWRQPQLSISDVAVLYRKQTRVLPVRRRMRAI